jgi:hypothetical protein
MFQPCQTTRQRANLWTMMMTMASQRQRRPPSAREQRPFPSSSRVSTSLQKTSPLQCAWKTRTIVLIVQTQDAISVVRSRPIVDESASGRQLCLHLYAPSLSLLTSLLIVSLQQKHTRWSTLAIKTLPHGEFKHRRHHNEFSFYIRVFVPGCSWHSFAEFSRRPV